MATVHFALFKLVFVFFDFVQMSAAVSCQLQCDLLIGHRLSLLGFPVEKKKFARVCSINVALGSKLDSALYHISHFWTG